jgi:hypothetical protein
MKRTKNKLMTMLTLLLLAALSLTKTSCKKSDTFNSNEKQKALTDKFFKNATTQNAQTTRVANALKQKAENPDFVNYITSKYGYPVWDKSSVSIKTRNSSNSLNSPTSNGSDTVVLIPIVQETLQEVETYIRAELTDTVAIEIHNNDEYKNAAFSNTTNIVNDAERIALRYMLFTLNEFGLDSFSIKDKRLFNHSTNYLDTGNLLRTVKINSSSTSPDNYVSICFTITTVTNTCPYQPNCLGPGGSCDWCSACTTTTYNMVCDGWWDDDGGGSGGGGGTGGGGSGGGTGGGGGGTGGGGTGGGDPCVLGGNTQNPTPISPCGGGGTGGGWDPIIDDDGLESYRGVIQFQWNGTTKSCSWAQNTRITKAEGISKLDCAFNQLTASQKNKFQCAYDYQKDKIQTSVLPVGNYSKKVNTCCPSCIAGLGNDNGARCDIQINKGNDSFTN